MHLIQLRHGIKISLNDIKYDSLHINVNLK